MKILVIGSKGFIGQHLCHYYQEQGQEVWGADVVVDYVNTESYFLIDSSNSDFSSVFEQQEFDLCVNCSGAASAAFGMVRASAPDSDTSSASISAPFARGTVRRPTWAKMFAVG